MDTALSPADPQQKPKATLTEDEEQIAELMVFGLDRDHELRGQIIKTGWPLSLEQAAVYVGYRCKRARVYLDNLPEFNAYRGKMLANRRKAEQARNLERAILIRDNEGQGLAADRTVQLKAIAVIEGTEGKSAVTVNVNQTNNTANVVNPGYVIRLPAQAPGALSAPSASPIDLAPASQETLTIDASYEDADG